MMVKQIRSWPAFFTLPWQIALLMSLSLVGCQRGGESGPELVWGKRGISKGDVVKPRAVALDAEDRLYLVDWTARIQVFDLEGKYLGPTWTTPDFRNGRPSGLSIARDGNLLVSDSHYSCLRIYSPQGKLLRTLGGEQGTAPGQLGYISDAVQDEDGYFYVAEFGENQRISKFAESGKFLKCWGSAGSEPGQFARIRAIAISPDGLLYCADACNHRIQIFDREGQLKGFWGDMGTEPGKLAYPYDLAFSPGEPSYLYVVELGNNRVQKFTPDGKSLGCWGGPGREPGKLASPWALIVDRQGRIHVIDSENHRVQRVHF